MIIFDVINYFLIYEVTNTFKQTLLQKKKSKTDLQTIRFFAIANSNKHNFINNFNFIFTTSDCGKRESGFDIQNSYDINYVLSKPEQWPWLAILKMKVNETDFTTCMASIISHQWILSSANCLKSVDGDACVINVSVVNFCLHVMDYVYIACVSQLISFKQN